MGSHNNDIAKQIITDIHNESYELGLPPECCIYKVPDDRRKKEDDPFTPHLISIGPIHHNNDKLKPMENKKYFYLHCVCGQLLLDEHKQELLEDYTTWLGYEEENIRKCYSEKFIEMDQKYFVHMMLLDSIFIMELFLRKSQRQYIRETDPLFTTTVNTKNVDRDLLLLENQLPFYILDKLYELVPTTRRHKEHSTFLDLARYYFRIYDPYRQWVKQEINDRMKLKPGWDRPKHFIDLLRSFFVPHHFNNTGYHDKFNPVIRSATKLQKAWIAFEPVSERSFLDIIFKKKPILSFLGLRRCRLQMPQAMIDHLSEFILLNLIIFEQYHHPYHAYISSYVNLIACLVQKEGDVNLLVESGIILNKLSTDKELIDLFRNLDNQLELDFSCYKDLSKELHKHYYVQSFYRSLAAVWLLYFKDLSRVIATFSGLLVTVSSMYTILGVKNNHWIN